MIIFWVSFSFWTFFRLLPSFLISNGFRFSVHQPKMRKMSLNWQELVELQESGLELVGS